MIFNYIFNTAGLAGGDSSGDGEEIAVLERPNTVIKHGGEAPGPRHVPAVFVSLLVCLNTRVCFFFSFFFAGGAPPLTSARTELRTPQRRPSPGCGAEQILNPSLRDSFPATFVCAAATARFHLMLG